MPVLKNTEPLPKKSISLMLDRQLTRKMNTGFVYKSQPENDYSFIEIQYLHLSAGKY